MTDSEKAEANKFIQSISMGGFDKQASEHPLSKHPERLLWGWRLVWPEASGCGWLPCTCPRDPCGQRPLAAACGHLRPLATTCGHLPPLEWLQEAAYGRNGFYSKSGHLRPLCNHALASEASCGHLLQRPLAANQAAANGCKGTFFKFGGWIGSISSCLALAPDTQNHVANHDHPCLP